MSDQRENSLDFYFDLSSPFGYLASERIEALAEKHTMTVNWKPIVLGFIFKITKSEPLVNVPLKGDYSLHDMKRAAREFDIPFGLPDPFPVATVAATRTLLWSAQSAESAQLAQLVHAFYRAYFVDNRNISDAAVVVDIASANGIDSTALQAALADDSVKALLKTAIDQAIERKVFGSPFIFVGDEPFWGQDRLETVDRWLETGGW